MVGHALTQFPAQNIRQAAHTLSILSAVSAAITCLLLYLETRKIIAPIIFMGVGLVVSQSTIIETYATTTCLMVAMYYWRNNKYLFLLPAILAIGIHHLAGLALLPLIIYRKERTDILVLLGALWYIYYPFALRPDAGWSSEPWYKYFAGQNFLIGGIDPISSQGLLLRLKEFAIIFVGGLGLATLCLHKIRDKLLALLILLPIIYYITDLPPQTYVYMMPAFAFIAIGVAKTLGNNIILITGALILISFNIQMYDIGRTLDPSPTSARYYLDQLNYLDNGSIVYAPHRGWEKVLSWNVQPGQQVEVRINERDLGDKMPTHYSIITEPSIYRSYIVPCVTRPPLDYGRNGVNRLEPDTCNQQTSNVLGSTMGDDIRNNREP